MKIKYMIRMLIGLAVMASIVGVSPGNILKGQALDISILGVPDKDKKNITSTYVVSETGVLSLWMLEPMQVAGLTSDQLARKIEKAYKAKGLFTSPVLQVISSTAEKPTENRITVGGDVKNTGIIPHVREMTLFQAVMAAGGPTEFGAANRVELTRKGVLKRYDLSKPAHKLIPIQPNDLINVPRKNWRGK